MADQALTIGGAGTGATAPLGYTIPGTGELILKGAFASLNGGSTTGTWFPCLRVKTPNGGIMLECLGEVVAAGASADVSWFPGIICPPVPTPAPSPNPLGTLFAWYDFSDSTTISFDGSGNIATIRDKTGNGHDASQGTPGKRPGTTTVNALQAGHFTIANQTQLDTVPFVALLPQPGTVACVFTYASTGDGTHFPKIVDSQFHSTTWAIWNNGNFGQVAMAVGTGGNINVPLVGPYTQQLFTCLFDGSSSYIRRNGAQTNGTVDGNSLSAIRIGNGSEAEPPFADWHEGAICEILYYSGALTTAQLSSVESYLKAKWGTP